jgi:hypothetical protein
VVVRAFGLALRDARVDLKVRVWRSALGGNIRAIQRGNKLLIYKEFQQLTAVKFNTITVQ